MTPLRVLVGDATRPQGPGAKIVAHICNDVGGWGAGFVLALSHRWPEPEREYMRWWSERRTNDFALGAVQLVDVEQGMSVANMIAQHDIVPSEAGPPIRYEALRSCLTKLRALATDLHASVHMPRIGSGLAGGNWADVERVIVETLCDHDVAVTVYDLDRG